jgi:four helix bundle protein
MAFRFRKFEIYKEIRLFITDCYLLSQKFPKSEQYILIPQLVRAATSILLNLSEGSMKKSDKEFNRFILIAIGSLSEVVAILDISLDRKYIDSTLHNQYMLKCETIAKKLYGFSRILKSKS